MPEADNLDALIQTTISDPIGIALARSLLEEAAVPYFEMDASVTPRQQSGNLLGWWTVRVPKDREAEAREILQTVEEM